MARRKPPERLRQSSLAAFDRCALSERFDREVRANWSGHPQARGQIMHRAIAEILRTMYRNREGIIPTDAAIDILQEALLQRDVDSRCGRCGAPAKMLPRSRRRGAKATPVTRESGLIECENGHRQASSFVNLAASDVKDMRWTIVKFATDNAFDIDNLVDVEQRIMATLAYPGPEGPVERVLSGQLDALFVIGEKADHAIVLDWKDTWAIPAPTELGFDGYFQQRFYAWLVFKNYPTVMRTTLREHYLRKSEYREADVWRDEIEDVEAELSALAARYDHAWTHNAHPPSPGKHCQNCPLPAKCPIFPEVREAGAITDERTAARYARELKVAQGVVEQRTRALKAWTDVHGPEPISSHKGPRVFGYRDRKRVARPDKDKLAAIIEERGARGITVEDLDRLYRESTQSRFEEFTPPLDHPGEHERDADLIAALEASVEAQKGRGT